MKILIKHDDRTYRWKCPEWIKFIGAALILIPIMMIPVLMWVAAGYPIG